MKRGSEEFEATKTLIFETDIPLTAGEIATEVSIRCNKTVSPAKIGQILASLRTAKEAIKIIIPRVSDRWFSAHKKLPPEFATRHLKR